MTIAMIPWKNKSTAIFFYFHRSLGNLTCSLFIINVNIFDNWMRQKQYFSKWDGYVESFTASDVIGELFHLALGKSPIRDI
jgi:succinate dehydrogenase/fumarate reductase cytochrome b subunit